jgi:hypothetical protein
MSIDTLEGAERVPLGVRIKERVTRLGRKVIDRRKLLLFRADLSTLRHVSPVLEKEMTFTTAVLDPLRAVQMTERKPGPARMLQGHLTDVRPGEELLAGFINDDVVAWCIVATRSREEWPLTETASALPLADTDAVFTAGFVDRPYRGRKLFQAMYGAAATRSAERGARVLWSWCEHWNEPSRKAMIAVGFEYVGSHERWRALGISGPLKVTKAGARNA